MQQRRTADFVGCLTAEHRIIEVTCARRVWIDVHTEPADDRFARGCRETHVSVEADDQDRVGADRAKPRLEGGAGERAVDIFFKELLRSIPWFWAAARRELSSP